MTMGAAISTRLATRKSSNRRPANCIPSRPATVRAITCAGVHRVTECDGGSDAAGADNGAGAGSARPALRWLTTGGGAAALSGTTAAAGLVGATAAGTDEADALCVSMTSGSTFGAACPASLPRSAGSTTGGRRGDLVSSSAVPAAGADLSSMDGAACAGPGNVSFWRSVGSTTDCLVGRAATRGAGRAAEITSNSTTGSGAGVEAAGA